MISINATLQEYLSRRDARPAVQCMIGDLPDVYCTTAPIDPKNKTTALDVTGNETDFTTAAAVTALEVEHFALVMWVKIDALDVTLASYAKTPPNGGWEFRVTSTGALAIDSALSITSQSLTLAADGEWHYVGFTFSRGHTTPDRVRMFVDDTIETIEDGLVTFGIAFPVGTYRFKVGQPVLSSANVLDGRVGWIAAFAQKFERRDFVRVKYRFIDDQWGPYNDNLVLYYRFEDGSGTTVTDASSSAADLTVTDGAPASSWVADPPWTITYQDILDLPGPIGQSITAADTKTTIGDVTLRLSDRDLIMTKAATTAAAAFRGRTLDLFLGTIETLESQYEPLFVGEVVRVSLSNDMASWQITAGDVNRFTRRDYTTGKTTLKTTITDVATTIDGVLSTASNSTFHLPFAAPDPDVVATPGYIQIDDEIIQYTGLAKDAGAPDHIRFSPAVRAQFGTTAAAHTAGADIEEIEIHEGVNAIRMAGRALTSDLAHNGIVASGGQLYDTSDFAALTGTTGRWDSRIRGLGESEFDPDDVEATISSVYSEAIWTSGIRWVIQGDEDNIRDAVERDILKASLAFLAVRPDGRLTVRSLRLSDTTAVASLSHEDVALLEWRLKTEDLINNIRIDYGWDPGTEEYTRVLLAFDADSAKLHGTSKQWKIESKVIIDSTLGDTLADVLKDDLLVRFAAPLREARVRVSLSQYVLEIGDFVEIAHPLIPDTTLGVRAVMGRTYQIMGRKVDLRSGWVELTMVDVTSVAAAFLAAPTLAWAGTFASEVADYAAAWGLTSINTATAIDHTSEITVIASDAVRIGWQHGIATSFDVLKNGAVAEGVAMGSTPSSAALTTTLADGDQLTLQETGTDPGQNNYHIRLDLEATVVGYGGDLITSGADQPSLWGNAVLAAITTGFDERTEFPAHAGGGVTALTWNTQSGDATTQVGAYVNGALSETVTLSGATGADSTLTSTFVAGDDLSLRYNGGTAPDEGTYALWLDYLGLLLAFGANFSTTGNLARPWAHSQAAAAGGVPAPVNESIATTAASRGSLAWKSAAADSTTVMALLLNGAVSETVALTGADGSATLVSKLALDDEVAWEYDAGTAPGESTWNLLWSGV